MYKKTRAEGFGAEVKRRIMIGTYVLSHGYYDAYYLQAQKMRRHDRRRLPAGFTQCDVIAGPVAPTVGVEASATKADDPVQMYLADIFTLPANLAGLPGMAMPCGFDARRPAGRPADASATTSTRRSCCTSRTLPAGDRLAPARAAGCSIDEQQPLERGYEVVIGLETHAQLSTRSKIF